MEKKKQNKNLILHCIDAIMLIKCSVLSGIFGGAAKGFIRTARWANLYEKRDTCFEQGA